MSVKEEIRERLFAAQDLKYRDFQSRLTPTVPAECFIGVRTPELKRLARAYAKHAEIEAFLQDLPHDYFEENQLHAFIISGEKDYERCLRELDIFLPYVDNWATCDQMSPAVFRKHPDDVCTQAKRWIASDHTYTKRFGIGVLMAHYLDETFRTEYAELVAAVRSEEYYVNMMVAWYFATALAKQYDAILPYIEDHRLDEWTHHKTIQKAVESCRISPEQKAYLKMLKRK